MAENDILEFKFIEKIWQNAKDVFLKNIKFITIEESAVQSLKILFYERLLKLYSDILNKEGTQILKSQKYMASLSMVYASKKDYEKVRDAVDVVLEENPDYFYNKYPLLKQTEEVIVKNYIKFVSDALLRLEEKKSLIEEKLAGDRRITALKNINADGADSHLNGCCTMRIDTDAGSFYYKPHDRSVDDFAQKFVNEFFGGMIKVPDTVPGNDFAFIERIQYEPVSEQEAVKKYYYNFGVLSCMLFFLGSTDMHNGNILACKEFPVPVDIETLLSPVLEPFNGVDTYMSEPEKEVSKSMCKTMILPNFFADRVQFSPLLSDEYTVQKTVPVQNGKPICVFDYTKEFCSGFEKAYRIFLSEKNRIIDFVCANKDVFVRYVIRNTSYYALILKQLYEAENLANPEKFNQILNKVTYTKINGKTIDRPKELSDWEMECLKEGDIPFFCLKIADRSVCGSNLKPPLLENFFEKSPLENFLMKMERASLKEMEFEKSLIRATVQQGDIYVKAEEKNNYIKSQSPENTNSLSQSKAVEVLKEMFAKLDMFKIVLPDGSFDWIFKSLEKQRLSLDAAGGLMLLCEKIAPYLCNSDRSFALKIHAMCLNRLKEYCTTDSFYSSNILGLENGITGMIKALSLMNLDKKEKKFFHEAITKKAELFIENPEISLEWDVKSGISSLILLLAESDRNTDWIKRGILGFDRPSTDSTYSGLIEKAADILLENRTLSTDKGLFWKTTRNPWPVSGFAKGMAGIGAALKAAYVVTGKEEYRTASEDMWNFEKNSYSERAFDWPNLQTLEVPLFAGNEYETGAAGIAFAAMVYEDKETLNKAVACIENKGFCSKDSLWDGNGARVDLFLTLYSQSGDKKYLDLAGKYLQFMVAQKEKFRDFAINGEGRREYFSAATLHGTCGILLELLRYLELSK